MRQVNMLREQAKLLRDLAARSTNGYGIRDKLLALAEQCEELANGREQGLANGDVAPSDDG
jgi:hypothetical protein